ncbi:MAG: cytidylate kinase [Acidimicrobiales bacterium]|jgi:cytidylate kinase
MVSLFDMQKKHIITLSGKPGGGKSSTSDKVAEMLSYSRYSSGDFVRKIIRKKGITLTEFNEMAELDHEIDHEIDEELRKLRNQRDIVIDSRLGFYWIPESFKVYLDLDMDVATARIYKDAISNEGRAYGAGIAGSIAEVKKQVQGRLDGETRRFKAMYGVDPYRTSNFDLVINTARHSPQTVALTVFDTYKKWLKSDEWTPVHSEVPMGFSYDNRY